MYKYLYIYIYIYFIMSFYLNFYTYYLKHVSQCDNMFCHLQAIIRPSNN
jgi:hypothetical protein